jgi:hypothetical protein
MKVGSSLQLLSCFGSATVEVQLRLIIAAIVCLVHWDMVGGGIISVKCFSSNYCHSLKFAWVGLKDYVFVE